MKNKIALIKRAALLVLLSTLNHELLTQPFRLVSVAGLAPARLCLKGRMRELLCIDGDELATKAQNALPPWLNWISIAGSRASCK